MARYPLIHFEGALFHITARGNDKKEIFIDKSADFRRYLQNIDKCKKKFPFKLYSFVFMPNHLHLLIEVMKHSIDKIMQVLQTGYTMYFNKKYNHTGHLFQGRYRSFLVDKESYLLELVRYIHLNPVRAGLVSDPSVYPWNSHIAFLNRNHEFNKVIEKDFILAQFATNPEKQIKEYKSFVLAGIDNRWGDVFPNAAWGQIVGKEKFIRSMERKMRKKKK